MEKKKIRILRFYREFLKTFHFPVRLITLNTNNTPQVLLRSLTPMYEHDATRGEIRGRCTLCLDAPGSLMKPGRILPTLAIIDLFRIRGYGHKGEDNKEMNTTVEEIFDEFSLEYNIKIRNQRE